MNDIPMSGQAPSHNDEAPELTAIMALSPMAIRIVDRQGNIVRLNGAARDQHAAPLPTTLRALWERDQPHRESDGRAMPYAEYPAVRALAGEVVAPACVEATDARDAGRDPANAEGRVLEIRIAPWRDDDGRVLGVVQIDVDLTEHRRLARLSLRATSRTAALESQVVREALRIEQTIDERARTLAAREATIQRDQRLSAVGQLAAGVMHDVNNTLNPIMAAAYLLRHHAHSPEAVCDYADRIRQAAEAGAATTSRIGRFIRQSPMTADDAVTVNLTELADQVLQLTEPVRQRAAVGGVAIDVVRDYASDVFTKGVAEEVCEALLNLVANAVDAMPRGGVLTIRTALDGDEALVSVRDTGEGMTISVRERAFEPFFTTKGAAGSGLGLAEVYGMVRRHGGTVTLESELHLGTTITMKFPAVHTSPRVGDATRTALPSTPKRILLVEDHDDGGDLLRRALRANGHKVDIVTSCKEARARINEMAAAAYELMITDVGLPDGSGWDLAAYARDRFPRLRLGVITGREPDVGRANAECAEFVLGKPLRIAELLAHIAGYPPNTGSESANV